MMSPMSDRAELPPAVREANEVLAAHNRSVARLLGGIALVVAVLLGSAYAEYEVGMMIAAFAAVGWPLAYAAWMSQSTEAVRRATDIKKSWDQRHITRELDQYDPEPPPEIEPTDPRWIAVATLLGRIDSLGGDPHAREVVAAVEKRLRGLLADIAIIDDALAADAALGGEGGARQERLASAKYAKEKIVDRLIDCIRDLHVELAVRDIGKADPILQQLESLVMQVEAEAEVDGVGSEVSPVPDEADERRAARRARQAQRES